MRRKERIKARKEEIKLYMYIERKGKGGIKDRRNGKFAQLQRNTFPDT